eukprot:COSAG02_NODE_61476_length_268_cov_0.911243_1_plen_89_part_11
MVTMGCMLSNFPKTPFWISYSFTFLPTLDWRPGEADERSNGRGHSAHRRLLLASACVESSVGGTTHCVARAAGGGACVPSDWLELRACC